MKLTLLHPFLTMLDITGIVKAIERIKTYIAYFIERGTNGNKCGN